MPRFVLNPFTGNFDAVNNKAKRDLTVTHKYSPTGQELCVTDKCGDQWELHGLVLLDECGNPVTIEEGNNDKTLN